MFLQCLISDINLPCISLILHSCSEYCIVCLILFKEHGTILGDKMCINELVYGSCLKYTENIQLHPFCIISIFKTRYYKTLYCNTFIYRYTSYQNGDFIITLPIYSYIVLLLLHYLYIVLLHYLYIDHVI